MVKSAALWVFILAEAVVVFWPGLRHTESWSAEQMVFAILGPLIWFIGLTRKQPLLTLFFVPLTWFGVLGHLLVEGLAAFDIILIVICMLIYLVTTADQLGLGAAGHLAETSWTPIRSTKRTNQHLAFIILLAALFCMCLLPLAYPELLMGEESQWTHYRGRIQGLLILIFGLQSMFIIDQINRRLVPYRRRKGALWLGLVIIGLGGGFFMGGF